MTEPCDARHPAHPDYDRRGGTFYEIGTRRVHESELTDADRRTLGLTVTTTEEASDG